MTISVRKTFGSSVLLWFRRDMNRDAVRAHWRGPHAQLVARTPGFRDYRQHHFAATENGLWPAIPGVETQIPAERRVDGMPEVILDGLSAPIRGRRQRSAVFADEVTAFERTILYVCAPGAGRVYDLAERGPTGNRVVILLRCRIDVERGIFAQFVRECLAAALAGHRLVRELRLQVFMPWSRSQWDTPGVAHDNPEDTQFHATMVLGFEDEAARKAFFSSQKVVGLADELAAACSAVHAYDVEATYIYVQDGRVTLPQVRPEPRPPLDPVRRALPPPPARAARTTSETPFPPARIVALSGPGAEDVVADATGNLLCGLADGRIVRVRPADGEEQTIGDTGGRPLGLEVLGDGRVLVCDARRGLLRLDPATSIIEMLAEQVDDIPLRFCSNVVAANDGTYWFTESTSRFDFEHYLGAMLEHRPSGRLLRRDADGRVEVVLDDLHFPNGLTLVDGGTALVFAETDGYRLCRLGLTGTDAGRRTVIADNLPGFPDNMSSFRDGRFWVAMVGARNASLDRAGSAPAWLRRLLWRRMSLQPPIGGTTWAMAFDDRGQCVADLQTTRSDFFGATGAVQIGGKLYLAGVDADGLLEIDIA